MRRVVLSVLGTIAGVGALLSFKTHPGAGHPLSGIGPVTGPVATAPASTGAVPSSSAAGSGAAPSSAAPKSSASSTAAPASRTLAGQAVQTRYGIVQVQVVLSGSSIQSVGFLQLTADDPRSEEINSQAAPLLVQQTMQVQSANIDGVSGATYTSQGYQQSLQSALDQAK
ncbi:MAG TPA: FMN-binding protein [Jatrophihabitans sp.]|nr:FMN-binding protein [Jatrophihabitans sp.]